MENNCYFSKYIKLLDKLTDEQIKEMDLINVFCEYISSNPEFKYNGTYLRDSIIAFQDKLTWFIKKRNLIASFANKLLSDYNSLGDWYIIIDNLYVITPDCKMVLLLNFERYPYFSNLIKQFNLFEFSTDYVSMRYINLKMKEAERNVQINNDYFETNKIKSKDLYKQIEIYSMVKNTLILKDKGKIGGENGEK